IYLRDRAAERREQPHGREGLEVVHIAGIDVAKIHGRQVEPQAGAANAIGKNADAIGTTDEDAATAIGEEAAATEGEGVARATGDGQVYGSADIRGNEFDRGHGFGRGR